MTGWDGQAAGVQRRGQDVPLLLLGGGPRPQRLLGPDPRAGVPQVRAEHQREAQTRLHLPRHRDGGLPLRQQELAAADQGESSP